MAVSCSSLLLVFDGSATPALQKVTLPLHPGRPFPLPEQKQVYLASGFPSLHPESPVPLSPALQLNVDCTDSTDQTLAAFARAELKFLNSVRFASTIRKADPSTIVLAASADDLQDFLDTYGGVLQITPLLTQGSSPEFATILEPQLQTHDSGLRLDYLTSRPLDTEQCTLCGKCGPACPEDCISSTLFLDLARCSFCNACVDICSNNAIDLHAMDGGRAEAAALVLLDGARINIDEATPGVYTRETLQQLFRTIFDIAVDEVITCRQSLCHYCARLDTGCQNCVRSCRFGAVSTTKQGIAIDQLKCTECGACVAACPTGAMQYLRMDDQSFVDFFSELDINGMQVILGSEEQLRDTWWRMDTRPTGVLFAQYPQPAALTAAHLLFLLARGASRVILLGDENSTLPDQAVLAGRIITALFDRSDCILAALPGELMQVAGQESRPVITAPMTTVALTNRRQLLAACLHHFFQAARRPVQLTGDAFADFGTLDCDTDKCTLCLACLNECPIGALSGNEADWTLNLDPLLCVQCTTCTVICPEHALQARPGLYLDEAAFFRRELARAEPMQCRECGKIFGTRQSFERVMAIMRSRKSEETLALYEYCDTCRVLKLYEAAQ